MNAAVQFNEFETAEPIPLAEAIRETLVAAGCDPETLNAFDALVREQDRLVQESEAVTVSDADTAFRLVDAFAECFTQMCEIADRVLGPVQSNSVPAPQIT